MLCWKNITDGRTNSLTPYTGVCGFFLSFKFATLLLASLTGELKSTTYSLFSIQEFTFSVNRKDLRALTLLGLTRENAVLDSQAIQNLNNRLFI